MRQKPREWNQKQIIARIAILFGLSAVALSFCVFFALQKTALHFFDHDVSVLLTSIEAGPLEFSRLNSRDFSEQQLVRLMEASNRESDTFREVLITSGIESKDIYAGWRSVTLTDPNYKLVVDRLLNFNDSIYPFRIRLTADSCQALRRFRPVQTFLFTFIFVSFLLLILSVTYAVIPVVNSIRNAAKIFRNGVPNSEIKTALNMVPYTPLKEITELALRSRL